MNTKDLKSELISIINERQQITYNELYNLASSKNASEEELKDALQKLENMGAIASRKSGGVLTYYILQEEPQLRKILIVEDDKNINKLMTLSVGKGFEIRNAYDGNEALKMIKEDKPDLVILDLMLPGVDGLEICQRVKKDPNLKDIIVIIVSAMDATSNRFKGIKYGADYYIKKPFDPEELRSLVTIFLRKKGRRFDPLIDLPNEEKISEAVEKALQSEYEIGRIKVNGLANFAISFGANAGMTILRLVSQLLQDKVKEVKGEAFVGFLDSDDFIIAGRSDAVKKVVEGLKEEFDAVLPFIYQNEGYKPIELGIEDIYNAEKPSLSILYTTIERKVLMEKRAEILKNKGKESGGKDIGSYTYEELRRMLGSDNLDITITRDPNGGVKLSVGKSPESAGEDNRNEKDKDNKIDSI
ncbi:MAG: response regulator [Candidatus Micrarchaeia archaeon]|jgi:DNA-binding response OmpR family regulator